MSKSRIVLLVVFVIAVVSAYTQFTDADLFDQEVVTSNSLTATTLDFSTNDTANESVKSLFYSVSGMIPSGFQVESVRLKKAGSLPFRYAVSAQKTGGADSLCSSLQLVVLQEWTPIYSGPLLNLNYSGELAEAENWEDLVFVVKLESGDASLANQSCGFDFTFTTQKEAGDRFSDQEVLQNTVSTGSWAN